MVGTAGARDQIRKDSGVAIIFEAKRARQELVTKFARAVKYIQQLMRALPTTVSVRYMLTHPRLQFCIENHVFPMSRKLRNSELLVCASGTVITGVLYARIKNNMIPCGKLTVHKIGAETPMASVVF